MALCGIADDDRRPEMTLSRSWRCSTSVSTTKGRTGGTYSRCVPSHLWLAYSHVHQALTLVDYCLHAGSENVVIYFRDSLYIIKTLREFQYVDEYGKDQGANIRQKAKDIANLLMDEARLRQERRSRASMRDRMVNGSNNYDEGDGENAGRRSQSVPPGRGRKREDDDLKRALEESKRLAEKEQAKQAKTQEERDLEQAIKLSEEEEARRAKAVQDSNASALFDDQNQL